MVGPIKMSAEPHVYEKQHFAASRREKSRTVFFFFYEKHGEKFSYFFLEKPVQLIDFTRIVHVNMNNIVFLKN